MKKRFTISARVISALLGAVVAIQAVPQTTNMRQAHEAMQIGRSYKGQGDLRRAEYMFRVVLNSSPKESNIHREAKDELEYYIPLMRIQRLFWNGNMAAVEAELFALQQAFEDHPVRLQEINRILGALQTSSADSGPRDDAEVDEKHAGREARMKLDAYFRQNKRYPTSRASLAEALDIDKKPLDAFEVERYSSDGAGYLLILRRKLDKTQTITLQHTGFLQ